jgi:molybdate transport system regulatory protein
MWDGSGDNAPDLSSADAGTWPSPSSRTAALACHERLTWLFRAVSADDFMAVEAESHDAARRAVHELNNLAGEALAEWSETVAVTGIRLTPRGRRVCVALLTLRVEHERLLTRFGEAFGEDIRLLDRIAVRTSARNQFVARVVSRPQGTLREEVLLELAGRRFIKVAITHESVLALGLTPGLEVVALVKASAVDLCVGGGGKVGGDQNRLTGRIAHVVRDGATAEVAVDLGAGLTGVAMVESQAAARAKVGQRATLSFRSDAIIIGRVA